MKRDLSNIFRWVACTSASGLVGLALCLPTARAQHATAGTSPLVASGQISQIAPLGLSFLNGNAMTLANVSSQSPLAGLGLQPGDVVLGINGRTVQTPMDVYSRLATAAKSGFPASIAIQRAGQQTAINVPTSALNAINQVRLKGLSTLDNQTANQQANAAAIGQGTTGTPTAASGQAGTPAAGAAGNRNDDDSGGLPLTGNSQLNAGATSPVTAASALSNSGLTSPTTTATGTTGVGIMPAAGGGQALARRQVPLNGASAAVGPNGVSAGTTLGTAGLTTETPASAPVYGGTVPVPPVYGTITGSSTLTGTPIGQLGNAAATNGTGTAAMNGLTGTSVPGSTGATSSIGTVGGVTNQGEMLRSGGSGQAIRPQVLEGMRMRQQFGNEAGVNTPGAANTQLGVPGAPLTLGGSGAGGAGTAMNSSGGLPGAAGAATGGGGPQAFPGQAGVGGTAIPGVGTVGGGATGAAGTGGGAGAAGAAGSTGSGGTGGGGGAAAAGS